MEKTKNSKPHILISREQEVRNLFRSKKYIEVITVVKKLQRMIDLTFLDYSYFNNKVVCLIYQGLSYVELGFYKEAYFVFNQISEKFAKLKQDKITLKNIIRYTIDKYQAKMAKEALDMLEEQFLLFYHSNYVNFLSNFAYICYKLEDYETAIIYYKKALYKRSKDIQLNLGIAQAQYYAHRKHFKFNLLNKIFYNHTPSDIKVQYKKTIEMFFRMETSFDTLLAIGKMYYFCEEYSTSLIFVQKALELAKDQPNARIHAYDWLSRIAFKTKHYEVAAEYYHQIISELINCSDYTPEVIHPKPNLYKMLEYLTQNKEQIRKHDVHYINKSIWGGIIAAVILESFEIYSNGQEGILFLTLMVMIVFIVSLCYINIYK
ncbi:unknown [Clostridium sp. CAG:768]|nr:unknown [Clostridium sp. CAG:768]